MDLGGSTVFGLSLVRNAGVRIVAHTLDLEAEPVALLGSVHALVEEMLRQPSMAHR